MTFWAIFLSSGSLPYCSCTRAYRWRLDGAGSSSSRSRDRRPRSSAFACHDLSSSSRPIGPRSRITGLLHHHALALHAALTLDPAISNALPAGDPVALHHAGSRLGNVRRALAQSRWASSSVRKEAWRASTRRGRPFHASGGNGLDCVKSLRRQEAVDPAPCWFSTPEWSLSFNKPGDMPECGSGDASSAGSAL